MSRETRIQRPFEESGDFQRALDMAEFRLGGQRCGDGERIVVETAEDFLLSEPLIAWARDERGLDGFRHLLKSGIEQSRIRSSDLSLVVVASSGYLKIADICFQKSLAESASIGRTVSFAECRPRALRAASHGATVSAYITLSRKQPRADADLRPWRLGTWLARATYRVALAAAEESIFFPTPLTDEIKKQHGLPVGTVRYFDLNDADPFQPQPDGGMPYLYVDEELLTRLHAEGGSPRSRVLQAQLVCDFANGIVQAAAARIGELDGRTWSEVEGSLIGRVVRVAAGRNAPVEQYEEKLLLVKNDPGKLMALVEHAVGLRSTFGKWASEES